MQYTLSNIHYIHKKHISQKDVEDLMISLRKASKKERKAMWDYILQNGIRLKDSI